MKRLTTPLSAKAVTIAIAALAVACNGGTRIEENPGNTSAACNKVWEYLPAPGQFINEGMNCTTPDQAAAWALGRLQKGDFVSLGAFGGYIVAGFDHSIVNSGGYDLLIRGNYIPTASEPGVVWVMRDANGNGLPDDTWYELKGSERGKPWVVQGYTVTYFPPATDGGAATWQDNLGGSGTIDTNAFHTGHSYYPAWAAPGSYTLSGTLLPPNAVEVTPGYWETRPYGWGYADNAGSDAPPGQSGSFNRFRISDAVLPDGTPANLLTIDFVKVQSAIMSIAGQLGEVSTDVCAIEDYNMLK